MFYLAFAGIGLLVIFYFYVRTESLRKELNLFRRQLTNYTSEEKAMAEVIEVLAFEQQAQLRKALARIKQFGHPDAKTIKFTEAMIEGIVTATVRSAKGHCNINEAFKKYLIKSTDISFEDFNGFISSQSDKIKNQWHRKSVSSYLINCQQLIDALSGIASDSDGN